MVLALVGRFDGAVQEDLHSRGLVAWRPVVLQGLLSPTGAGVSDGVRRRPRLAAVRQQRDGVEVPRRLWGVAGGSRAAVDVFGGRW